MPQPDRLCGPPQRIPSWEKFKDYVKVFPGHNTSMVPYISVTYSSQCTSGSCCDTATGCFKTSGTACDDGLWCNGTDTCSGSSSTCSVHAGRNCADAFPCTTDSCNEASDACDHTPNNAACNDSNVCTTDTCSVASGCVYTNNSNACNDGAWCNGADTCSGGSCSVHAGRNCADAFPCTTDSCNEGTDTCDHTPNNAVCEDGNVCTTNTCSVTSGCVTTNNSNACDDGAWCNGSDTCSGGSCSVHAGRNCADAFPCTTDSCNESTDTCDHTPNNAACNDSNVCTTDTCSVASGCVYTNNSNACNDGLWCNGTDTCSGGSCSVHAGRNCDDGNACTADSCNEGMDRCDNIPSGACCVNSDCNDNNPCTDDICNNPGPSSSCVHTNNTNTCDDGLWCNGADTCGAGSCSTHAGRSCDDSNPNTTDTCNEATDKCVNTPSSACNSDADCNDNDPCTTDTCSSGICSYTPISNCNRGEEKGCGCTTIGNTLTGGFANSLLGLIPIVWIMVMRRRSRR